MKQRIVFVMLILAGFSAKAQEKIFMPFFETININWHYQYATSRLLKTYMVDENRYQLLLPMAKGDTLFPTPTEQAVQKTAQSINAPYYALGELNRVGETVIVSFAMYKTADGSKVWSDRLKATSPDDLDPVMKKLAHAMGTKLKSAADGDMYSVTNNDAKQLNKINAIYRFGVSLSGGIPISGLGQKGLTGFGFAGSYDARNLILDIRGQYLSSSNSGDYPRNANIFMGSLEGYYPFKADNITPFIGGGFAISHTSINVSSASNYYNSYESSSGGGLMLIAGGGYLINRNSNVNLRVSANIFTGLYQVNSYYISGMTLRAEILF